MHTNINKVSNSKNSKIERSKPKAQEPKALNLNNSLRFDPKKNTETSDKT